MNWDTSSHFVPLWQILNVILTDNKSACTFSIGIHTTSIRLQEPRTFPTEHESLLAVTSNIARDVTMLELSNFLPLLTTVSYELKIRL